VKFCSQAAQRALYREGHHGSTQRIRQKGRRPEPADPDRTGHPDGRSVAHALAARRAVGTDFLEPYDYSRIIYYPEVPTVAEKRISPLPPSQSTGMQANPM